MKQKNVVTAVCRPILHLPFQSVCLSFAIFLLASCGSSKKVNTNYIYFREGANAIVTHEKETLIQANDLLSIQVFSKTLNQEQVAIFNIATSPAAPVQGYQVSVNGNIEMPVIGAIKAIGLTKEQLEEALTAKLSEYVKDPSVIVKFLQFNVNVLGEVHKPGIQKFLVDKVTVLDAIGAAGDLTDFGKREDIKVIREENGKRVTYTIDLRNKSIFSSPVYLLQPNDIVYVEPTNIKLKNMDIDPDSQRKTNLLFSVTSIVLSVATIIVFATRNN